MRKEIIESLLKGAGIAINGDNAYDPQIHNERFYDRVLRQGSLGLGESYVDGWWDCEKLDQFSHKVLAADLDKKIRKRRIEKQEIIQTTEQNKEEKQEIDFNEKIKIRFIS